MRNILHDTTNVKKGKIMKKKKNDKESVLNFIKDVYNTTTDYNLKYDLSKCIEIIEGKENQEIKDLKEALEEVIQENNELIEEKTKLYLELEDAKNK
ncbi:wd40 repeat-containing protein [Vairimorpha ceranae]|uniref:Wd40 repeat-containing protein n=1 Tax=Vairimorpha ceranae TaxID=40302 RepID=A0A0F9WJ26_9MICR|nr:wd40 repeat-containing protein [Vairimorpha ceranae]KAF5141312.1 hypothetical protein G9O61_00g006290 [Vairimorpha ceranae]KKO76550.1 wd40 repeat-containing protein [Vairimorpha ceranae]